MSVFYPEIIITQMGAYLYGHILSNFLIHSNYECPPPEFSENGDMYNFLKL